MDETNGSITNLTVQENSSFDYYYEGKNNDNAYISYIVSRIDVYIIPIVFVIGITGNMASLCVFLTTHLSKKSWSVYLAALSVSDSGFLICVVASWSNNIGIHIYHSNVFCQALVYLTYVWSFLSVWFVVAFTFERYLVIQFPLRTNELTTPRRARLVVVLLTIFALVLYNFALWTSGVKPMYQLEAFCTILPEYYQLLSILTNVDAFVTFVLPFLIILFCNAAIVYKITRYNARKGRKQPKKTTLERRMLPPSGQTTFVSKRLRSQPLARSPADKTFVTQRNGQRLARVERSGRMVAYRANRQTDHINRLTYMLLVVSGVFLLLNLPTHAIRFYVFIMQFTDKPVIPSNQFVSWQKIFQYVYYCNFSVNFFLYSLCGRNFRLAFRHMLKKTAHRLRSLTAPICWRTRGEKEMGNLDVVD